MNGAVGGDLGMNENEFNQMMDDGNRDIILRNKYSGLLQSSAENFIVGLFEKINGLSSLDGVNLEVPITAAMAIITNTNWHQPSEAQIEYDFIRECIDTELVLAQMQGGFEPTQGSGLENIEGSTESSPEPQE